MSFSRGGEALEFLEPVLHEDHFGDGLGLSLIQFHHQKPLTIHYKGCKLRKEYVADVICYEQIIVELKALDQLSKREESQILNYLKATGLRVGLLINFGSEGKLERKRLVR